jgi:hypothetical protein
MTQTNRMAIRARGFRSTLVVCRIGCVLLMACSPTQDTSEGASAVTDSIRPDDSIATGPDVTATGIRLADFCAPQADSDSFSFRFVISEPQTGDLSGYYVRVNRVVGDSWAIRATEASGSFGDLLPVMDLVRDKGDTLAISFSLGGLPDSIRGPRLRLRFSCDSAWGTATGPYPAARDSYVSLSRVFVGPEVRR